jgi:hypothetical protein
MSLPQARRARVPQGKDLTEFAQAGGDVGAWILRTTCSISTEIQPESILNASPAADEIDDGYLSAILEWGQSHGYEPRIAAPKHAGELMRIVMDRQGGE